MATANIGGKRMEDAELSLSRLALVSLQIHLSPSGSSSYQHHAPYVVLLSMASLRSRMERCA